jgi:hypothetical protein
MKLDTAQIIGDIYANYADEAFSEDKRTHMGASALGDKCKRAIYYDFRWYGNGIKDGRILRLFNTGKREESRVVCDLLDLGFIVGTHIDYKQIQCRDSSGHIGGSVDGIIDYIPSRYGLLESDKAILEIKTHSEKNFRRLVNSDVKSQFPKHYTQMQIYMGLMEIPYCLYAAVNKNTDELYFELMSYDIVEFDRAYAVAKEVAVSVTPPARIRENPSWFECKMCNFHDVCHMSVAAPGNCRTCVFSRPIADGEWTCDFHNKPISKVDQLAGCDSYKANN